MLLYVYALSWLITDIKKLPTGQSSQVSDSAPGTLSASPGVFTLIVGLTGVIATSGHTAWQFFSRMLYPLLLYSSLMHAQMHQDVRIHWPALTISHAMHASGTFTLTDRDWDTHSAEVASDSRKARRALRTRGSVKPDSKYKKAPSKNWWGFYRQPAGPLTDHLRWQGLAIRRVMLDRTIKRFSSLFCLLYPF